MFNKLKVDVNTNTTKTNFFANDVIRQKNDITIRISDLGDETNFNKKEKDRQNAFTSRSFKDPKNRVLIKIKKLLKFFINLKKK